MLLAMLNLAQTDHQAESLVYGRFVRESLSDVGVEQHQISAVAERAQTRPECRL